MWKRRNKTRGPTQAVAWENMRKNQKTFDYPASGFVTPIEQSLLYSMISEPNLFPQDVVEDHIRQEDFSQYLHVQNCTVVSYAQLSAIVALAAEKWPPPPVNNNNDNNNKPGIPQILYKAVLQCVVRYAEANDLDRETEVHELLRPLERQADLKEGKRNIAIFLPYYLGITASLVTANPLPMILGSYATVGAVVGSSSKQAEDQRTAKSLQRETHRMANVEKASLLDEEEERE